MTPILGPLWLLELQPISVSSRQQEGGRGRDKRVPLPLRSLSPEQFLKISLARSFFFSPQKSKVCFSGHIPYNDVHCYKLHFFVLSVCVHYNNVPILLIMCQAFILTFINILLNRHNNSIRVGTIIFLTVSLARS